MVLNFYKESERPTIFPSTKWIYKRAFLPFIRVFGLVSRWRPSFLRVLAYSCPRLQASVRFCQRLRAPFMRWFAKRCYGVPISKDKIIGTPISTHLFFKICGPRNTTFHAEYLSSNCNLTSYASLCVPLRFLSLYSFHEKILN